MTHAVRRLSLLAAALVIAMSASGGCMFTNDLDGLASGVGSAGGTGGQTTGPGGTGGEESDAVCAEVSDCIPTGTECNVPSCDAGICVYTIGSEFQPIPSQAAGDCRSVVCNDAGGENSVNIDDPFDDLNECTDDTCVNGQLIHEARVGMPCGEGFVCASSGACAECNDPGDCGDDKPICQANACVPVTCQNETKDVLETDVDCGGADCAPCPVDGGCLLGSDCETLSCSSVDLLCLKATCTDKIQNGDETDLDCGGADGCAGCAQGLACTGGSDCDSGVCSASGGTLKCAAPKCDDGTQNGGESDVDCGGPCSGCAGGKSCVKGGDCVSGACKTNICCTPEPVQTTCAGKCKIQTNQCGQTVNCGPCVVEVEPDLQAH